VPRRVYFVERLPHAGNGKVQRSALPQLAAMGHGTPTSASASALTAPSSPIEGALAGLWSAHLGGLPVGRDEDFFLLGGDSLGATQLVTAIDSVFGVAVPLEVFYRRAATVAGMAQELESFRARRRAEKQARKRGRRSTRSVAVASGEDGRPFIVVRPRPMPLDEMLGRQRAFVRTWPGTRATAQSLIVTMNGAGTRQGLFVCLQSEKGVTVLARHLGPDQPIHGLRSGHRIMTYTDENVALLAGHYADEMIALQPDGPFLLGGNCQGSRIARAVAQELRERGRDVSLLLLLEPRTFPSYGGRVALIFARDSHLNPYGKGGEPDAVFRRAYPAGYTVDLITGIHGGAFFSNNVDSLISVLRKHLVS
jgi:acyl carrier protein